MAQSRCPKCNNSTFEIVEQEPKNSSYKLMFVQCSSCGSVIGVLDYFNIGTLLKKLKDDNEIEFFNLNSSLQTINNNITIIDNKIKNLK